MTADAPAGTSDRRVRALTAVLVPALAAWNNLLSPRLSPAEYTAANAGAAAVLLAAARAAGVTGAEIGLDRRRLGAGGRLGAAFGAPLAGVYLVALAVPPLRPRLRDARIAPLRGRRIAADVLVRIPVGTVLWEEVAFRGVLQAAFYRLVPPRSAAGAGAVLFGLWHVGSTLSRFRANEPNAGPRERAVAVLAGCTTTGVAGVLFGWLRRRSGSLLAPAVVHLAANDLGLLAAAAAHRLPAGGT